MKSIIPLIFLFLITGCMGPPSLHKAVLSYDETINQLESEMLLLNIVRAYHELPDHFTVTSSIAATFDFRTNAGFTGSFPESASNIYNFTLGASAAENPTLSIVPVQGEEFTKRILTPMDESKFGFLIIQGTPIDMVMRLMARGIEIQDHSGRFERFILNLPSVPEEYKEFRRRAMHLAWLNANRKLFVKNLVFEDSIGVVPSNKPSAGDLIKAHEKGYRWRRLRGEDGYELKKTVIGRVVITNYDTRSISNSERKALNALASANPRNYVLIDIRPGYPGGDFPLFGAIKLRSLNSILTFLAAGITKSPEFDVSKDPRTGNIPRNPRQTLAIDETDTPPEGAVLTIPYKGKYYSIKNTSWNLKAFTLLSMLFQMTVTDVSKIGIPVTISK